MQLAAKEERKESSFVGDGNSLVLEEFWQLVAAVVADADAAAPTQWRPSLSEAQLVCVYAREFTIQDK